MKTLDGLWPRSSIGHQGKNIFLYLSQASWLSPIIITCSAYLHGVPPCYSVAGARILGREITWGHAGSRRQDHDLAHMPDPLEPAASCLDFCLCLRCAVPSSPIGCAAALPRVRRKDSLCFLSAQEQSVPFAGYNSGKHSWPSASQLHCLLYKATSAVNSVGGLHQTAITLL